MSTPPSGGTRPGYSATRPGSYDRSADSVRPPSHTRPVNGGTRPYNGSYHQRPPYRTYDYRYARPSYYHVRPYPYRYYGPPSHWYYRPYYCSWWVHPYWRYQYSTVVVVGFGFPTWYAWYGWWTPPPRYGWYWVSGYYSPYGVYYPGYWAPYYSPPAHYVYVPGHWSGTVYTEGYYRTEQRKEWEWVDGYYLEDGSYVEGHWRPTRAGPEGYVWEPGFFDGDTYVDGFWRPEYRSGYAWVSASYDADGVRHNGYWLPLEEQGGQVWIPGWFDGEQWITGYWVAENEYRSADPKSYEPPAGVDDGWDTDPKADAEIEAKSVGSDIPIALPVNFDRDTAGAEALPDDAAKDVIDVSLVKADLSAYPEVTLDLRLDWREGNASGTAEGWKVEVWDDGANVDPELTSVQQADGNTETLRVTWTARDEEPSEREVVVRLTRNGLGNGFEGTKLTLSK